jgi:hypothetical protein
MTYDHEARKRSYGLLAEAFSLTPSHAMPQRLAPQQQSTAAAD